MKFSEITEKEWPGLQLYLDTCILPVTGMTGNEQPWEAGDALEGLRDILDGIEFPYKGRVVTYPALHYCEGNDSGRAYIEQTCRGLRSAGFTYVVVVTAKPEIAEFVLQEADLLLSVPEEALREQGREAKRIAGEKITQLWMSKK
ncbi:DUF2487 family protein [Paenibacillus sp. FJAT-26967]|uniref:DUF2487 family protein n=1 Tax=Paenibacillus sp. FJAT-26967 TaxID=1729690 RepID=UPI0008396E4D|nr:DUF2487 family protein [Paenibacillus sp. FJAT-26967]